MNLDADAIELLASAKQQESSVGKRCGVLPQSEMEILVRSG